MRNTLSFTLCFLFLANIPSQTFAQYRFPRYHHWIPVAVRKAKCLKMAPLICNVMPTRGHNTSGKIFFRPVWTLNAHRCRDCYVHILGNVTGLSNEKHGFHIHAYGDLSATDGTSTGPHFNNPRGIEVSHGFSTSIHRHWGDLDNLEADSNGVASYDRIDTLISLRGIIGRGVTIHISEDQGPGQQPSGSAGERIGYCVIGFANPAL